MIALTFGGSVTVEFETLAFALIAIKDCIENGTSEIQIEVKP